MVRVKGIFLIIGLIIKSVFIIFSWILFFIKGNLDISSNLIWRNFNEYLMYLFGLIFVVELIFRFKKIHLGYTILCVITAYLMFQGLFPDGTNLERMISKGELW